MSILNIARILLSPVQASVRSICIGKYLQIDRSNKNASIEENLNDTIVEIYDDGDRSEVTDYETSIRYMQSTAYYKCYGDHLVWELYRRKALHSRYFLVRTRKTCIRNGKLTSSSPCPICRDKYLVFDYRHVKLLKQFISPYMKQVIPSRKTGLCQRQQTNLIVEVEKAKNYGTITFDIPFRKYDYEHFHKICLENMKKTNINL